MHAPQIIYLLLTFLSLGYSIAKHGEPKTGQNNCITDLIATIIIFSLLYWGGFFSN